MAKRGPKQKYFVTDEMLKEVKSLAFKGALQCEMAGYFGMSKSKWYHLCNENPELRDACTQSKAKADIFVRSKLMSLIEKENAAAIFFYHKVHLGAVEVQKIIQENIETPKTKDLTKEESEKAYNDFFKNN